MPNIDSCQLTTKDYTILEVMRERHPAPGDAFSALLQRKISNAVVVFREDIPPSVATLSSRVAYQINDGPAETHIVAHGDMPGLVGMLLPVRRQIIWLRLDRRLAECRPHLGVDVKRRSCGAASADVGWFGV
ncbi:hypothetical protein LGH82_03500 [Mesorhizobium sp. PAMC28654]|uniref:hypothetical protein n=1 Tax=Mesorhizobium sp. PAMC28654 TaxID=2880934 RepID=UPI001D0B26B2|nr:hypothetical protein [Mesorhizobium sp. PAMC28654]UDL90443.1 hypothetical protein LGH82_03500 [Mesorhizobium sp. PAMC28654]